MAGVVPPANLSEMTCQFDASAPPATPKLGRGEGVGRKEGREEKLLNRSILNDLHGRVTPARDDVRYPAARSLPPPPLPPAGQRCAELSGHPLGCSVQQNPVPRALS